MASAIDSKVTKIVQELLHDKEDKGSVTPALIERQDHTCFSR